MVTSRDRLVSLGGMDFIPGQEYNAACAVTRSQTKLTQSPSFLPSLNPPSFVPEDLINTTLSKKELITAQQRDPSLA
ncbi:hypothetical protein Pcinc_001472 [Petrolisthes cinctipes]|uniref:Uncharacterized protein n=1 Tax=Petrolisthes cinctipes TaxID=88211 RepID=A0AAE1GJZ4_PETCI|nr:hypothetical protein Pcinc_001472 [Petrolisthes cinctipes]